MICSGLRACARTQISFLTLFFVPYHFDIESSSYSDILCVCLGPKGNMFPKLELPNLFLSMTHREIGDICLEQYGEQRRLQKAAEERGPLGH